MPLRISITAANTVSRASAPVLAPPASISETISATSITVTASARISVPKGSPTRCATTSAWCTAASTLANRPKVMSSAYQPPAPSRLPARISQPAIGAARVQAGMKLIFFMVGGFRRCVAIGPAGAEAASASPRACTVTRDPRGGRLAGLFSGF
jgi:hypothetical protein